MTKIKNVQQGIPDIDEGCYLLLINPEEIPHLVYLQDGRYYSLTYKGVELAFSFLPYLERLIRTNKKMLFVELSVENLPAFKVFTEYLAAGEHGATCFYPVRELLLPESNAELIFDLIPELYLNNLVKSAMQLNMPELLDDQSDFEMSEYTKSDVQAYISKLKDKYAERD